MNSALYPNWQEKVAFGEDGPQPTLLASNDQMKVVLAGLMRVKKSQHIQKQWRLIIFLKGVVG